jgi:hypothetical protein
MKTATSADDPEFGKTKRTKTRNPLADVLSQLLVNLERFFPAAPDPDLENRRQVYVHVADFIGERLACQPAIARDAVHRLCGEQDETLLAEAETCDDGLLEQARALLQEIQVRYLLADSHQARRITTIVFGDGDRAAERRITEALVWDQLPFAVRDENLRHGARQMGFRLYP